MDSHPRVRVAIPCLICGAIGLALHPEGEQDWTARCRGDVRVIKEALAAGETDLPEGGVYVKSKQQQVRRTKDCLDPLTYAHTRTYAHTYTIAVPQAWLHVTQQTPKVSDGRAHTPTPHTPTPHTPTPHTNANRWRLRPAPQLIPLNRQPLDPLSTQPPNSPQPTVQTYARTTLKLPWPVTIPNWSVG